MKIVNITWGAKQKPPQGWKVESMEKIVAGVFILITVLAVELQYIVGLFNTPEGTIYLGTVHFPSDYFYYLSQFAQGKYSWLSSTMLYTPEKLQPVLVGWQNVLTGRILTGLGLSVILSYQVAVGVYLGLFLLLSYRLIKEIFPKEENKRLLAFFIFLTSTGLFKLLKESEGWQLSYYNYWYNLGNFVARFGPTPHHLIAYSLGTAGLLLLIRWFKKGVGNFRTALGLIIIGFLLASINPVHWGLLVGTSFFTAVAILLLNKVSKLRSGLFIGQKKMALPHLFLPVLLLFVVGIPAALYVKYVFSTPPYNLSSAWEATQWAPASLYWLIVGSGLVIIYGAIGIYPFLRKVTIAGLLAIIFLALVGFFYMTPLAAKLHLTNVRFWPSYVYIVWAVLAVEGIYFVAGRSPKLKRFILFFLLLIYIVSVGPSYYAQYKEILNQDTSSVSHYLPREVYQAYREAERLSGPESVFLVQWPYNESFPALTGRKSTFGFELNTIDYETKMKDTFDIIDGKLSADEAEKIVRKYNIEYIMVYAENNYVKTLPFLRRLYSNPILAIDKVNPGL